MLVNSSTGRFVLYVDGVKWIDYTGNTAWGAGSYDNIAYNYGGTVSLDDLALNSTDNSDGLNDNSWCGDGIVYKFAPSGSGTLNQWLNSGGVSGSMNYSYVDDFPYDSDTSLVYASASMAGDRDQYVMSDVDLGNKKIRRIWAEGRAKKASADSATVKLGWMPSGYSASLSTPQSLLTSYAAVKGAVSKINPATSASWTNADLNAIEGVLEI
jgi:hypothetical protein